MGRKLADGVYQELVTEELDATLAAQVGRAIDVADLDPADAHITISRHLRAELERALGDVRGDDGLAQQVALANRVLAVLVSRGDVPTSLLVAPPGRELRSIFAHPSLAPRRPRIPLGTSALLTLGHGEPRVGAELAREFESADRVDALISFVTMGGVRQLRDAIDHLCRRHQAGAPPVLRIITTTYTGATEAAAVEELAGLPGVELKVSYDSRRTRLHAKAWLFHRATGLSTAYVGSANLSAPALTSGLEWMMKVAAPDLPEVIKKFAGAFETLWSDREFEPFDPADREHQQRLRGALTAADRDDESRVFQYFTVAPYEFQREILEQLEAERAIHGRHRNLVVAATGTGKTIIAAFDYARRAAALGIEPRLLFLAHTRQILLQARETFRNVLRRPLGDLLTGDDEPSNLDHLFATIQTVRSRNLIERLGADYWDHVIVDECHHVPSESYQDVVPRLRPNVLVGLTATPERHDGKSLLADFGGRVAAELRLWHALERQLLCPFEYYGVHDGTTAAQMEAVQWRRGTGYDPGDLDRLYTGNHARADRVLTELRRKLAHVGAMRAIGFCITIEHAAFMAHHFAKRGIPAIALSGASTADERAAAQRDLASRKVNVIFTCDLFNEGVDLPYVDTLLLLRPTQSATLFLQQLGRGLRLDASKSTCLVLDFIGQHRAEFRFDTILTSLTGRPRSQLASDAEAGFPFLPSGCSISLDRVARDTVLRSLRGAIEARWSTLVAEASGMAGRGDSVSLAGFLRDTGRPVEDLYRLGHGSWTKLLRDARVADSAAATDHDLELCHSFEHLLHLDDRDRLVRIERWLDGDQPCDAVEYREALMLAYQIKPGTRHLMASEAVVPWLRTSAAATHELTELSRWLADRVSLPPSLRPVPDWPLVLHRHYSRREILTACGSWTAVRKVPHQQGIERLQDQRRELLFVTLDKSDGSFSPTTSYRDYAISADRFHWESQNAVAAGSQTAERYAKHAALGWSIHLFVQPRKRTPFAYCGPVHHESQSGSRPIAIVWRLEHTLPAALATAFMTLANG